jgi:hypothetical protein
MNDCTFKYSFALSELPLILPMFLTSSMNFSQISKLFHCCSLSYFSKMLSLLNPIVKKIAASP